MTNWLLWEVSMGYRLIVMEAITNGGVNIAKDTRQVTGPMHLSTTNSHNRNYDMGNPAGRRDSSPTS